MSVDQGIGAGDCSDCRNMKVGLGFGCRDRDHASDRGAGCAAKHRARSRGIFEIAGELDKFLSARR